MAASRRALLGLALVAYACAAVRPAERKPPTVESAATPPTPHWAKHGEERDASLRRASSTRSQGATSKHGKAGTNAGAESLATQSASELGLLSLDGFEAATLATPQPGLPGPRPVVIVAHGAGGTPEWHCAAWRALTSATAFVACPRGRSMARPGEAPAYYFPDHFWLEREVMALAAALERELGARADTRRMLYAGYSQGATMGALMIIAHAARFPRLVLVEGGFSQWNVAIGKRFRAGGGERVLFACGTAHCAARARRSAEWLERASVVTRVEYAEGAGHVFGGEVAERVARSLAFLSEGDARFDFAAP